MKDKELRITLDAELKALIKIEGKIEMLLEEIQDMRAQIYKEAE